MDVSYIFQLIPSPGPARGQLGVGASATTTHPQRQCPSHRLCPPEQAPDAARQELRTLLESEAVLDGSSTPLRGRSGRPLRWLLYTPQITLTAVGNRVASQCLLEQLEPFGNVQLATYGVTGVPLLVGVTVHSAGRYDGLLIRESPKRYGSLRQIDGPVRRDLPVVIVDDSLVSGKAFRNAVTVLERAGLSVAGLVCLVEFADAGGRAWAESHGYRVESVFELSRDLRLAAEPPVPAYARPPTKVPQIDATTRCDTLPDVARHVAAALLAGEDLELVPTVVHDADAAGGAFVSMRDAITDKRLVRSGFFAIDEPAPASAISVAEATARCIRQAGDELGPSGLSNLKLGVTCISAIRETRLADLDARRFGLIVRSPRRAWQIGAALPDTPERESEAQQYHECLRKAGLRLDSPQQLYRFTITKVTEQGCTWHPYGAGVTDDPDLGSLPEYLRARLANPGEHGVPGARRPHQEEIPPLPWQVHGIGVSIYRDGRLAGIHVSMGDALADCLQRAITRAWRAACDDEMGGRQNRQFVVSVLYQPHQLGTMTAREAARWLRASEHTVLCQTTRGSSTVLPHVAGQHGWDALRVAQLALRKASGVGNIASGTWTTYRTSEWLITEERAYRMHAGFPTRRRKRIDLLAIADQIAHYTLAESSTVDRLPAYGRHPVLDTATAGGGAGRVLLALTALTEAGQLLGRPEYCEAGAAGARRVIDGLRRAAEGNGVLDLPGLRSGPTAECQALLLIATVGLAPGARSAEDLFAKVSGFFRSDGMITPLRAGLRLDTDHDVLPGLALTAVARYAQMQDAALGPPDLERQLFWYQRRFAKAPRWLAAGWLMQGWAATWERTEDQRFSHFVLEIADWTIARQFRVNGAFLTNPASRTGCFNSAYLAEGIAAALTISRNMGDHQRTDQLTESLCLALGFVISLTIQSNDLYCMPAGRRLIGGVRRSPVDPVIRIDQPAHVLRAVLGAIRNGIVEIPSRDT